MTLASTELVYQADYMNVSPRADGAVFSGIGNRINFRCLQFKIALRHTNKLIS